MLYFKAFIFYFYFSMECGGDIRICFFECKSDNTLVVTCLQKCINVHKRIRVWRC